MLLMWFLFFVDEDLDTDVDVDADVDRLVSTDPEGGQLLARADALHAASGIECVEEVRKCD